MSDTVPNGLESAIGQDVQDYASQNPLAAAAPMVGVPQNQVQPPAPLTSNSFLQAATNPLVQQPTLSDSTGVSPSIRTQIAQQADKLAAANPNPNAPGAWAKSLIGGVQSALANVGNIGEVPNGAGPLYGIGKVLQGQQQQKAQASQNARADALAQSEVERNHQLTLNEQANMYHQQLVDHITGNTRLEDNAKVGQKMLSDVTSGPDAAPIIAKDVPFSDIQNRLAKGEINSANDHVLHTGNEQVGEDKDGNPIYQARYTVVGDRPNVDVPVSKDFADRYNKVFPSDSPLQEGTKVPYRTWFGKEQDITNAESAQAARDKATADITKTEDEIGLQKEYHSFGQSPDWLNALAASNGDEHKALQAMTANPSIAAKYPNLAKDAINYYGGDKVWDDLGKQRETARHDQADEEDKALKIAADKAKTSRDEAMGDVSLSGSPAYLGSIQDPRRRAMVQDIGTGRFDFQNLATIVARNPGVLEDVAAAYPQIDMGNLKQYPGLVKDYKDGNTARAMNAGATALESLNRLSDLSTPAAVVPGTVAHKKYEQQLLTTATEYAKFTIGGNGQPTEKEVSDQADKLRSRTGYAMRAPIEQAANSILDKRASYKQQWQNGTKGLVWNPQMPDMNGQVVAMGEKIANGGKPPIYRIVAPDGGVHVFNSRDQADHFSDQIFELTHPKVSN